MLHNNDWISDAGATSHMCCDKLLFNSLIVLDRPIKLVLLDESSSFVSRVGSIVLSPSLTLRNILYTPKFKHHLILVHKLAIQNNVKVTFLPTMCSLQDLRTDQVIREGKVKGNLYIFVSTKHMLNSILDSVNNTCNLENKPNFVKDIVWDKKLGHPLDDVLKQFDNKMKYDSGSYGVINQSNLD